MTKLRYQFRVFYGSHGVQVVARTRGAAVKKALQHLHQIGKIARVPSIKSIEVSVVCDGVVRRDGTFEKSMPRHQTGQINPAFKTFYRLYGKREEWRRFLPHSGHQQAVA